MDVVGPWVDFIGVFDRSWTHPKPGSPQRRKDRRGIFILVIPSQEAIGSQTPCLRQSNQARFSGYGTTEEAQSHTARGFLFGGLLPFLRQAQEDRTNVVSLSNHAPSASLRWKSYLGQEWNLMEKVERLEQEYNKLRKASEFIMSIIDCMDPEDLKKKIFEKRKKELSAPTGLPPYWS